MATFDLPHSPSTLAMTFRSNTGVYESGLINSAQTLDRGGSKWAASLNYSNMSRDVRADMLGFIASLRGQSNRVRLPVWDNPKRGGYGGTPLVAGASQTGNALAVDGVTNKTDWIKAGDYFSVDVNGEHELKMATQDSNSSVGAVTLVFEPSLRDSPLNNAVVWVQDGSLPRPEGIFLLDESNVGWSSRPGGESEISSLTIQLVEDVFATQ